MANVKYQSATKVLRLTENFLITRQRWITQLENETVDRWYADATRKNWFGKIFKSSKPVTRNELVTRYRSTVEASAPLQQGRRIARDIASLMALARQAVNTGRLSVPVSDELAEVLHNIQVTFH